MQVSHPCNWTRYKKLRADEKRERAFTHMQVRWKLDVCVWEKQWRKEWLVISRTGGRHEAKFKVHL